MRTFSRLILVIVTAAALLHSQAAAGRLRVMCLDGSPCPLEKTPTAPPPETSCCVHVVVKPCHAPLPPTCIVKTTPGVQLSKPAPADAPAKPLATLLPSTVPADAFAPKLVLSRRAVADDFVPTTAPPVVVHGARAPPPPLFIFA